MTARDPREVVAELREEYEALALMSYHGTTFGFAPDMIRDDVEKIRNLLADAGMTIEFLLT